MKTMKLWRNILVMTAVMLSLASCSSNDNDQEKPFTVCPEELVKFFACEMNSKHRYRYPLHRGRHRVVQRQHSRNPL